MYQSIQQYPVQAAIASTRKTSERSATVVGIFIVGQIMNAIVIYEIIVTKSAVYQGIWNWISLMSQNIEISIVYDNQTAIILVPVYQITTLVQIYSRGYMKGDPHIKRYMSYISQFCFAMQIQVTSNNIQVLFIGWEQVGQVSYLLVNYWFTSQNSNRSAMKALQVNRVGDIVQTIAILITILLYQDSEYGIIFSQIPYVNQDISNQLCILLIIAACAKSGQIGLHHWLPAAMAAPTPTSALLHSSTMVTINSSYSKITQLINTHVKIMQVIIADQLITKYNLVESETKSVKS